MYSLATMSGTSHVCGVCGVDPQQVGVSQWHGQLTLTTRRLTPVGIQQLMRLGIMPFMVVHGRPVGVMRPVWRQSFSSESYIPFL